MSEALVTATPIDTSEARESLLRGMVAGISQGDDAALGLLFDALCSRVHGVARRILGSSEDAEEVMLDVFRQVWAHAGRYDPARGTVVSWVLRIAYTRAIDRKRAQRSVTVSMDLHPGLAESAYAQQDSHSHSHEDHLHAMRQADALTAALATLPEVRRRLIELAFYEGLSHSEIAERTGLALGTVKSHVRRGLDALRLQLPGLA